MLKVVTRAAPILIEMLLQPHKNLNNKHFSVSTVGSIEKSLNDKGIPPSLRIELKVTYNLEAVLNKLFVSSQGPKLVDYR